MCSLFRRPVLVFAENRRKVYQFSFLFHPTNKRVNPFCRIIHSKHIAHYFQHVLANWKTTFSSEGKRLGSVQVWKCNRKENYWSRELGDELCTISDRTFLLFPSFLLSLFDRKYIFIIWFNTFLSGSVKVALVISQCTVNNLKISFSRK